MTEPNENIATVVRRIDREVYQLRLQQRETTEQLGRLETVLNVILAEVRRHGQSIAPVTACSKEGCHGSRG